MPTTQNFEFSEIDESGETTLDVISDADNFNNWMFKTILPYCKGDILEIGSGIGNISERFLSNGFNITLTDIRDGYCDRLRDKFKNQKTLKGVMNINLVDDDFDTKHADLFETFDTIFALNVVEHIKDDQQAIDNAKKLLRKGGNLIILVPSYQALYNGFDVALEHYRRYTKPKLNELFKKADLPIIKSFYFNVFGILGWFVTGSLLKKETIPGGQMSLYNKLVPFIKLLDYLVFKSIGLSTITVGTKK